MLRKTVLLAVLFAFFLGCKGPSDPEIRAQNARTIAEGGDVIGTLPDGRTIRCCRINRGMSEDHYIYIVEGASSVTTNFTVSNDDTTTHYVHGTIGGK